MEKVLLVGLDTNSNDGITIDSSVKELKELAEAAGGEVVSSIIQKRDRVDSSFYIGKGKVEEISIYCEELDIDTVIFNDELSGAQMRNVEKVVNRKIVDRTNLILDIFASRALTKEGKLQVELAQLKYRLPRLIGLGTQLSRTGGGIGTRGPGEMKLEIDRRHILSRITDIKKQLKDIEKNRDIKRNKRSESNLPVVALVGYTNAGKSTLFNNIIKRSDDYTDKKDVYVKDMLFASLETKLRKSLLPNGQRFLVTDTVGFVSKLPTHLIEAFKGTLEEVKYADLLLHVVDITNEDLDIQMNTTMKIIKDLQAIDKPIITVFNKTDKIDYKDVNYNIEGPKVYISAKEGIGVDKLMKEIEENLPQKFYDVKLLIPYSEGDISSKVFSESKVEEYEYIEEGIKIKAVLNHIEYNRLKKYILD
ncbi:GTPase HflX [Clostridiisalibacter paucivorans]|uniref:GTPase HflX n=1 Tax=Clostridiisalibacter paucivorans TaxID=408753 RepID=UPI000479FB87|nr:GTPase HflX [Clostridiisalibacter paucivorans]